MKKVVFEPETTINFKEVNNDSIVGIQWIPGNRSLIVKTMSGYIGMGNDDISECWVKPSKIEYIEKAVSINGSNAVLLEHLGDVHNALKDFQSAKYFWKKALDLNPNNKSVEEKINNIK